MPAFTSPRAAVALSGLALGSLLVLGLTGNVTAVEEFRTLDGSGNNLSRPRAGAAGTALLRHSPPAYGDGIAEPAGQDRPGARTISNRIAAQTRDRPNRAGVSDLFWLWGQFLDHDIVRTPETDPAEELPIPVPPGDLLFEPFGSGGAVIPFTRSAWVTGTGDEPGTPRQQLNALSAYVDGSAIYGCDPERLRILRALDGSGRLRTGPGNLLPRNDTGIDNAGGTLPSLFLAGDLRANEHVALAVMHTVWLREHNRQAGRIRRAHPRLSGDEVFERARARVGALIQAITYNEFLPLLLGADALGPYTGWDPSVDAGISQEFATAAYRFGHTMVSPRLLRLRPDGSPVPRGHLPLEEAFFAVRELTPSPGIEPYLRGLARQRAQELDTQVVDPLRNFLFGLPGAGGLDLVSLNIQRGRDHGLADLNTIRRAYGLAPLAGLRELSPNRFLVRDFRKLYRDVENLDPWIAGLAERHVRGAMVGPTFHAILVDQFRRLRDGDRLFYRRVFSGRDLERIEATTLAEVIRRNARVGGELQDAAFLVPDV